MEQSIVMNTKNWQEHLELRDFLPSNCFLPKSLPWKTEKESTKFLSIIKAAEPQMRWSILHYLIYPLSSPKSKNPTTIRFCLRKHKSKDFWTCFHVLTWKKTQISEPDLAKVLLFTDKTTTSNLYKAISVDFHHLLALGEVQKSEKELGKSQMMFIGLFWSWNLFNFS